MSMLRAFLLANVVALIGMLALPALPASAAQGTPDPDAGIAPVVWHLIRIVAGSDESVPDDSARYTVQFLADGSLAIVADCNSGSGTYQLSGSSLTVGEIATTLVACEPGSLGDAFGQALQAATSYAYADGGATLALAGDAGELHLVPSLVGVVWEWQEFAGGNAERIAPDDPGNYTIAFDSESRFTLQADCNVGSGTYTVDGATIDLTVGPLTRVACPSGSLSDQFLGNLEDTTGHVFREGSLYLSLMADAGIAEFAARPSDDEATPTAG